MERTWRWFGKKDKITLAMLKQIGVEGIVTALHDVPLGEVWTREKIRELREYIESYGMRWSVVESLPVVETIKYGGPDRDHQIARGYPERLKGKDIPLSARIMAVADVYDALVSERPYKKAFSVDEAFRIITEDSGTHFDPEVVDAFVKNRETVEQIMKTKFED